MEIEQLIELYDEYCEHQMERQSKNEKMGFYDIGRSFDDFISWLKDQRRNKNER